MDGSVSICFVTAVSVAIKILLLVGCDSYCVLFVVLGD